MPATHVSFHYHLIFSTKYRQPSIAAEWRPRLHAYLGGIVRGLGGTPVAIGGTEDHVHLLIGLGATHRFSDVVREVKSESSRWVHMTVGLREFQWQPGYGAYTVSASVLPTARTYIEGQEAHHQDRDFKEEYVMFLRANGVEFDERYLW